MPSLDTSNRDSLFQEAWRILCQKDSDLDIWKIIRVKIKLFRDHGALLLQNAVTSAEHVVTFSLTQLVQIFSYTAVVKSTALK